MNKLAIKIFAPLLVLGLSSGCVNSGVENGDNGSESEQVTSFTREEKQGRVVIHSTFGSSDIKNWRALDNSSLVIETYSHGDFLASFSQPCTGIRFTDTLGFSTMGPFQLDKSTKIVLPGGRWCHFKSLEPYEQDKAEVKTKPAAN